ncbi:MAG: lipoprotein [Hyphomonas sp. BRH_c22]|uniref:DMT family transporter n=1 Tax=Hyphomonas sp. BRH_c22 TaxID=1629710 RepID=UPI0005F0F99D|nr:DMT family transporter [Hyphomonas sp. BRH_c22]KJS39513.1 MAG: lipoprotein [Hyphomonas sp. BRH_c22]
MTSALLPVAICLMSAILLAATNVLVKRGGDILTSRMVLSIVMALSVLPLAFFVPLPPRETLPLLALSMAVHWFYQFSAIRAMHRGDLSLVFPVMRGLGPLATAMIASIALKEALTLWQMAGLVTASAAIIVFALPTGATVHARRLDRAALFWSVMTALGVGLYAVADARAVREMPNFLTFVVWLFLIDWIGVTLVALWQRRGGLIKAIRPQIRGGIIAGLLGSSSYGLAIYAYTLTDAAIVTALRETSVVFAAAFGAFLLHEGFGRRRTVAAAVLACGLILMQAGA